MAQLTNEEFLRRVNKFGKNIEIKNEYQGGNTKMECKCKICGHEWTALATNLTQGRVGCKKCNAKRRMKTTQQFIDEMKIVNPNIQILGEYAGAQRKIHCYCIDCDNEFDATPTHLLNGHGCNKCRAKKISKKLSKPHSEFLNDVKRLFPYLDLLTEYEQSHKRVLVHCNKCGHEWWSLPESLMVGCGCPNCSPYILSKGEVAIRSYLDDHHILYDMHKTFENLRNKEGYKLSYDFYLPNMNMVIEFQGIQHYKPVDKFGGEPQFKKQVEHDNIKKEYAKENNLTLLEISYKQRQIIYEILNDKLQNNTIPVTTILA